MSLTTIISNKRLSYSGKTNSKFTVKISEKNKIWI